MCTHDILILQKLIFLSQFRRLSVAWDRFNGRNAAAQHHCMLVWQKNDSIACLDNTEHSVVSNTTSPNPALVALRLMFTRSKIALLEIRF